MFFRKINLTGRTICFVTRHHLSSSFGGVEYQTYLLAEKFIEQGWIVEVVTQNRKINNTEYLNKKIRYFYYKPSTINLINIFRVLRTLLQTNSFFYYERSFTNQLASITFFKKIRNIKTIWAIANEKESTEKCNHLGVYLNSKHYSKAFFIKRILKILDYKLSDAMIQWGRSNADYVFCQSLVQKNKIKNNFKLNGYLVRNSHSIPEVIVNKKENIILWIGKVTASKRPEVFFDLVKFFGNTDYKFIIIGESGEYKTVLDQLSVKYKNFLHAGYLHFSEVNKYLQMAKILVNTSNYEGFPNTFIQAWLNRVLVISYELDTDQLLSSERLGLLTLSQKELIDKLEKCQNGQLVYDDYLDRAEKYARENFDINKQIQLIIKILTNEDSLVDTLSN